VSEDPFVPTAAAPDPAPVEPTPTVGAAAATFSQPAGSALLDAQPVDPHPERLVGAAFAGGLVAAVFLKGLAKRRHR
jgi:CBS domain-containing protein